MNWREVGFSIRDSLLAQKIAGVPVEELAGQLNMRPTTLDRRLREWANINDENSLRRPNTTPVKWDSPPIFDGNSVVTGDYHLPFLDYDFAELMLKTSAKMLKAPRRLIIAGDLFNMAAFSYYLAANPYTPSFRTELDSAVAFLGDSLGTFDTIEVLLGNHELRFVYRMLGQMGHEELEKIVGVNNVRFHEYSHCILTTPTGEWRVTHQKNYSINAQTVGKKLAHKFRQHIITHHQHKVSKGFDDSGQSVIIDNGCMADPSHLDYANQTDNTAPVMTQSFVVVKNGTGHLFANNRAFTNLQ